MRINYLLNAQRFQSNNTTLLRPYFILSLDIQNTRIAPTPRRYRPNPPNRKTIPPYNIF